MSVATRARHEGKDDLFGWKIKALRNAVAQDVDALTMGRDFQCLAIPYRAGSRWRQCAVHREWTFVARAVGRFGQVLRNGSIFDGLSVFDGEAYRVFLRKRGEDIPIVQSLTETPIAGIGQSLRRAHHGPFLRSGNG